MTLGKLLNLSEPFLSAVKGWNQAPGEGIGVGTTEMIDTCQVLCTAPDETAISQAAMAVS